MNIECYAKSVYGKRRIFPEDVTIAQAIQVLTGRKTLTEDDIEALQALGHQLTLTKGSRHV